MKKLIFKKGVNTIRFPVWSPIGDYMFHQTAMREIAKIKALYYPRKNVKWNYTAQNSSSVNEVTVTKLK